MGLTTALFAILRRHASTAFCGLALAQLGVAFCSFMPLPHDNMRLPWTLWGTGACCIFLSMTSCMCAAAMFALHLGKMKNWTGIKENHLNGALKDIDRVYMDDLSLLCLIHGVMFFLCFGPLMVMTIVYGMEWADEQSDEVRSQAVFVQRLAGFLLLVNIIMPIACGLLFYGRVYKDDSMLPYHRKDRRKDRDKRKQSKSRRGKTVGRDESSDEDEMAPIVEESGSDD